MQSELMKNIILLSILLSISVSAFATDPIAMLSDLSSDSRSWVEQSCPKLLGPSSWSRCVNNEISALNSGIPDISKLTNEEQDWVKSSCPKLLGPSSWSRCVNNEISALNSGIPDISKLTNEEQDWVKSSCPKLLGPSSWSRCVNKEISALKGSVGLISKSAPNVNPPLYQKKEITAPEPKAARTLILGGRKFKEDTPGEFTSWKCSGYFVGGKTLVELGQIPSDYLKQRSDDSKKIDDFIKWLGFILYDGTNTGDIVLYKRRGLNHRWDWGSEGDTYAFIIEPDGTGIFYDFSNAKKGEKVGADTVYKCRK